MSKIKLESAKRYNKWSAENVFHEGLPDEFIEKYTKNYSPEEEGFAEAVASYQRDHRLKADGKLGNTTYGHICRTYAHSEYKNLTEEDKSEIVSYTVKFEGGGRKNPYAACNLNAEYEGLFDRPKRTRSGQKIPVAERTTRHRASKYNPSGGFHIGLSYGPWQAAQEPGSLGIVLNYMNEADDLLFRDVFGPHCDDMLESTNAKGRRRGKRSPRTLPVGGHDLWSDYWVSKFREAAQHEVFRDAQRRWVADKYLEPALKTAELYNLDSRGDLAVLFDIAIQFGVGGMRSRVKKALKPDQEYSPNNIRKVINKLPKHLRKRREHILTAAGQNIRYVW